MSLSSKGKPRRPLLRLAAVIAVCSVFPCGLFLYARVSNPSGHLETAFRNSIASVDELTVTMVGPEFPTETFLLKGSQKVKFEKELIAVLSVEYRGFLWSGHTATTMLGGLVGIVHNGVCREAFVFETSRGDQYDDKMIVIERLRMIAREGQATPETACDRVRRNGVFFWFGIPWEYEYVIRPRKPERRSPKGQA